MRYSAKSSIIYIVEDEYLTHNRIMLKRELITDHLKYIVLYLLPLMLLTDVMSYTIYRQDDIRTFHAVLKHFDPELVDLYITNKDQFLKIKEGL